MSRTALVSKTNIIAAVMALAVVGGGGAVLLNRSADKPQTAVQSAATEPPHLEHISYQGQDGKSALELLKAEADVKTETATYGEYVASINGKDGGGSKFWMFYVNGAMADVSADKYVTKTGETIEWKLQ